jgi:hypothetical protein
MCSFTCQPGCARLGSAPPSQCWLGSSCWLRRLSEMFDDGRASMIVVTTPAPVRSIPRPQKCFILALCKVGQPTQCGMTAEPSWQVVAVDGTGRVGKETGRSQPPTHPLPHHRPLRLLLHSSRSPTTHSRTEEPIERGGLCEVGFDFDLPFPSGWWISRSPQWRP